MNPEKDIEQEKTQEAPEIDLDDFRNYVVKNYPITKKQLQEVDGFIQQEKLIRQVKANPKLLEQLTPEQRTGIIAKLPIGSLPTVDCLCKPRNMGQVIGSNGKILCT